MMSGVGRPPALELAEETARLLLRHHIAGQLANTRRQVWSRTQSAEWSYLGHDRAVKIGVAPGK
jgi:hypothetical protein